MPLNLAHLLNSAPVSPPRSHNNSNTNFNNGPSPSQLSELLSPSAVRQSLRPLCHSRAQSFDQDPYPRQPAPILPLPPPILPEQTFAFTLPPPVFNNNFQPATRRDPLYQRPITITAFSYNDHREQLCGSQKYNSLKAIQLGVNHAGFDLNHGLAEAVFRDESIDEGLDGLLNCLVDFLESSEPTEQLGLYRRVSETRFVTWRGMMTKLCGAVYDMNARDSWEMNVMAMNGTLYIEEHVLPRLGAAEHASPIPTYYGHSYESLLTSTPGTFEGVNTNNQWVSVVKANLNGHKLILGGEVDCVRPEAYAKLASQAGRECTLEPEEFVEIKTSMVVRSERERWTLQRYKMLKFWLQSFLLGTSLVHVGFRDQSGAVCSCENYETQEIPALVKRDGQPSARWSASLCLDTGAQILDFLSHHLSPATHPRQAFYETLFMDHCASSPSPGEPDWVRWQEWPVFRIKFVSPTGEQKGGKRGRVEVRELEYEKEIVGEVQAQKRRDQGRIGFLPASWILEKIKVEAALLASDPLRQRGHMAS